MVSGLGREWSGTGRRRYAIVGPGRFRRLGARDRLSIASSGVDIRSALRVTLESEFLTSRMSSLAPIPANVRLSLLTSWDSKAIVESRDMPDESQLFSPSQVIAAEHERLQCFIRSFEPSSGSIPRTGEEAETKACGSDLRSTGCPECNPLLRYRVSKSQVTTFGLREAYR
jgi:hypothetical protein